MYAWKYFKLVAILSVSYEIMYFISIHILPCWTQYDKYRGWQQFNIVKKFTADEHLKILYVVVQTQSLLIYMVFICTLRWDVFLKNLILLHFTLKYRRKIIGSMQPIGEYRFSIVDVHSSQYLLVFSYLSQKNGFTVKKVPQNDQTVRLELFYNWQAWYIEKRPS